MLAAKDALHLLLERSDLTHGQMLDIMRQIMSGALTPVQIAGITQRVGRIHTFGVFFAAAA